MQQITERIYIGHWESIPGTQVDGILSVALDLDRTFPEWEGEYAKVGLVDGPGNHPGTMLAAVCMLHQLMERRHRVMVMCHMGCSRSPIVVATYLAARSKTMSVRDAVKMIRVRHDRTDPGLAMFALADVVLPALRDILRV